ncbi:MAG: hypothetical protein PVI01_13415 [Gemmatimonadales bacterium]|jgi:fermentation-respiration switch protein FrsA (DUF1100 family)
MLWRRKDPGEREGGRSGAGRLWLAAILLLLAIALAVVQALKFDAPEEFWSQKGELAKVEVHEAGWDSLYAAFEIELASSANYSVRGYLRVPRSGGRFPAVIVIGGTNTGRLAAELFTPEDPYVILGLDYPWDGPAQLSWWQFLVRVFAVRRAMLLTPSAVMLGADYLARRDDVDSSGLVYAGASFGAQLITVAGALDPRAGRVLVIYGGGDYAALLRTNLQVQPMWLRSALARVGAWLVDPIEPLDYVGQIAPRETIIINGRRDERIPVSSVERLFKAAREPKQLIWLDAGHIRSSRPETIAPVLAAASRALDEEEAGPQAKEETESR